MRKLLMRLSTVIGITMLLAACGSNANVYVMSIEQVTKESISVNCSEEINKGKKNANSLGFLCEILIDEQTILLDKTGNKINIEQLIAGESVEIVMRERTTFSEKNRTFKAAKLQLHN